jgi:hypothetical protein
MLRLARGIEAGQLPREILFDGPAGTGKTFGILLTLHLWLLRNPMARLLIARAHRASLSESVLVTYEQDVLPLTGHEWLASGAARRTRQNYLYPNGAEIVVAGLDKASKVLSSAYDAIFVNEAIELGVPDQWETLLSRQRRPGRPVKLGILIGDTNPGDPGHWLKKRCDAGLCERWPTTHEHNPALHDGDDWTEAGLDYLAQLDSLSGTRRKRLRHGLWAAGEGAWFGETFDPDKHVSALATYDPHHETTLAVDTGVHVGAVLYQVKPGDNGPVIHVLADHYAYDRTAQDNARDLKAIVAQHAGGKVSKGIADPAGGARTGFGTTHLAEYAKEGLHLRGWLKFPGCVVSGLNLVESMLADNAILIHPRCERLIAGLTNYMRKKRNEQWVDEPEDPQHPHEDVVDALRSALLDQWPEGRRPAPKMPRVPARRVFG